jgi:tetratricopeptide (TPR) repeat protein
MADIRRYLANEPVQARQGNWIYYSKRFVRRNALAVSAAALFLILTMTFVVSMSLQIRETEAQRDLAKIESQRAQTVSELVLGVFRGADRYENPGSGEVTARELLDRMVPRVREDRSLRNGMRAELMGVIGKAYLELGKAEPAIETLNESLQLWSSTDTPNDPNVDVVLRELGNAYRIASKLEQAERVQERAFAVLKAAKREGSLAHANLLADFARLQFMRGNLKRSENLYLQGLAMIRDLKMGTDLPAASILVDLATALSWEEDLPSAETAVREAIKIFEHSAPEFYPARIVAEVVLADVLTSQGKLEDARKRYVRAIESQRQLYGKNSARVTESMGSLAKIRLAQKHPREAADIARSALQANYSLKMQDHVATGYLKTVLASALLDLAEYPQAESELREALVIFSKKGFTSDHQYTASAEYLLGEVLLATDRLAEASQVLSASMTRWQRGGSPEWRSARTASALGEVEYRQGRVVEAEQHLVDSYRVLTNAKGVEAGAVDKARERIARFYRERGELDKLNALLATPRSQTAAVTP